MRSRELRANPTDAERRLWAILSARKIVGVRFNRQFPIGPYICDFVSRTAKLVIEADGGQHAEAADYDADRTRFIEAQGYRVLRFWNNDILANTEGVAAEIERVLRDNPSPSPSRKREGDSGLSSALREGNPNPPSREREWSPNPSSRSREGSGEGMSTLSDTPE